MKLCEISQCEKRRFARGWCQMHYTRWYRFGHPLTEPPTRKCYCSIDGCVAPAHGHGLCAVHYRRLARGGTTELRGRNFGADHHLWVGDRVGYGGVHQRLKATRGPAAAFLCPCGFPAAQWAYDYTDPAPSFDERGCPYSTDLSRYTPMCAACHKRHDLAMRQ